MDGFVAGRRPGRELQGRCGPVHDARSAGDAASAQRQHGDPGRSACSLRAWRVGHRQVRSRSSAQDRQSSRESLGSSPRPSGPTRPRRDWRLTRSFAKWLLGCGRRSIRDAQPRRPGLTPARQLLSVLASPRWSHRPAQPSSTPTTHSSPAPTSTSAAPSSTQAPSPRESYSPTAMASCAWGW